MKDSMQDSVQLKVIGIRKEVFDSLQVLDIFNVPKTMEELTAHIESYSEAEKAAAITCAMMAYNYVAAQIKKDNQELEQVLAANGLQVSIVKSIVIDTGTIGNSKH